MTLNAMALHDLDARSMPSLARDGSNDAALPLEDARAHGLIMIRPLLLCVVIGSLVSCTGVAEDEHDGDDGEVEVGEGEGEGEGEEGDGEDGEGEQGESEGEPGPPGGLLVVDVAGQGSQTFEGEAPAVQGFYNDGPGKLSVRARGFVVEPGAEEGSVDESLSRFELLFPAPPTTSGTIEGSVAYTDFFCGVIGDAAVTIEEWDPVRRTLRGSFVGAFDDLYQGNNNTQCTEMRDRMLTEDIPVSGTFDVTGVTDF